MIHKDIRPAYESHDDAKDPAVQLRMTGLVELGGPTPGLGEMKACCRSNAENGSDPMVNGTIEAGLLMPTEPYEELKQYARSLTVQYGKRRARK